LSRAIERKDYEALDAALQRARELQVPETHEKVAEGKEVHRTLAKKLKRGTVSGGALGSLGAGAAAGAGASSAAGGPAGLFKRLQSAPPAGARKLFGGSLEDGVAMGDLVIPRVCFVCVEYLRERGLDEPGIFRVGGARDAIDALARQFEANGEVKLQSVHDVSSVLKQYLRQLSEPIFPFAMYAQYLDVASRHNMRDPQRIPALAALNRQLPRSNHILLSYLFRFFLLVSQHEANNKMNINNLAIVLAPNLLRPERENAQSMMVETGHVISLVSTMIEFVDVLFEPPPRDLKRV
jgi:hypothetical protein